MSLPTITAELAGWIPLVYFDERTALGCELVSKKCSEHAVPVIHCNFTVAKPFVRHCLHVDIFHAHIIILLGYRSRFLMQEVFSEVCKATMQFCDLDSLFLVVLRAVRHAAELLLCFCKAFLNPCKETFFSAVASVAVTVQSIRLIIQSKDFIIINSKRSHSRSVILEQN